MKIHISCHIQSWNFWVMPLLELIVTDFLTKVSHYTEGGCFALRSANTVIIRNRDGLGMNDYLLLSKGEAKTVQAILYLANTYEAYSVIFDQGIEVADKFVHNRSCLKRKK